MTYDADNTRGPWSTSTRKHSSRALRHLGFDLWGRLAGETDRISIQQQYRGYMANIAQVLRLNYNGEDIDMGFNSDTGLAVGVTPWTSSPRKANDG